MTKDELKLKDETVKYYLAIDEIRLKEKELVELFFENLADKIRDNMGAFAKDPEAIIKLLVLKWIKENKGVLGDTAEITQKFMDRI